MGVGVSQRHEVSGCAHPLQPEAARRKEAAEAEAARNAEAERNAAEIAAEKREAANARFTGLRPNEGD